ncbi:MAG: single-stranded DNA-binding protein, partial [Deltaproteobacteria bacterium]
MNQVSIIGRLGQDPELRYTPSGKAVARMSVAVNERYGENEKTYWFPVICWNGLGETVSQYLHKGSKVAVSGRLTTRSYERDGET